MWALSQTMFIALTQDVSEKTERNKSTFKYLFLWKGKIIEKNLMIWMLSDETFREYMKPG